MKLLLGKKRVHYFQSNERFRSLINFHRLTKNQANTQRNVFCGNCQAIFQFVVFKHELCYEVIVIAMTQ